GRPRNAAQQRFECATACRPRSNLAYGPEADGRFGPYYTCEPWITSVNTGEGLGAKTSLPWYSAVSRCVPLARLIGVSAGMVIENWPLVTCVWIIRLVPSSRTTVPEAFGVTVPRKVRGVPGVSNALAGSCVADAEVNAIVVGFKCELATAVGVGF